MTFKQNTADGGTNATVVTAANTGGASGDAFDVVVGSATFSTAQAAHGSLSVLMGTDSQIRYAVSGTEGTLSVRWYSYISTQPSSDNWLLRLYATDGSTTLLTVMLKSNGTLALDRTGTRLFTSGAAVPSAQWVRYELVVDMTAGTISGGYYSADSTTAIQAISVAAAGLAGTPGIIEWRNGSATTGNAWIDDFAFDDASGVAIGPYVEPSTPPALVDTSRLRYLIDYSDSIAGAGGALSFTIAQTSGTTTTPENVATGVWAVSQSTTETLSYTVTVAEAGGDTDAANVTVPQVSSASVNVAAPLSWDPGTVAWV